MSRTGQPLFLVQAHEAELHKTRQRSEGLIAVLLLLPATTMLLAEIRDSLRALLTMS